MQDIDELYMRRCLQLARCAAGSTSPNPMVGAVIVCDGRIIGEGYHRKYGEPHEPAYVLHATAQAPVRRKASQHHPAAYGAVRPADLCLYR